MSAAATINTATEKRAGPPHPKPYLYCRAPPGHSARPLDVIVIRKAVSGVAIAHIEHRMKANGHTAPDIAKYLTVSRATLYRYLADEAAQLRQRARCFARPNGGPAIPSSPTGNMPSRGPPAGAFHKSAKPSTTSTSDCYPLVPQFP
jgi:hypothetical protein